VAKVFYRIPSYATNERQTNLAVIELQHQRRKEHDENALEIIDKRLPSNTGVEMMRDTETRFINTKRETLSRFASDYRRKLQKQEQIAAVIASVSPYASFTLFATRLAGTDLGSEDKFIAATEQFYDKYFEVTSAVSVSGRQREEKLNFLYTEPAVSERLKSGLAPLSILLLFTALFLVGGYVIFLRGAVK
jgi:hypothetical protein